MPPPYKISRPRCGLPWKGRALRQVVFSCRRLGVGEGKQFPFLEGTSTCISVAPTLILWSTEAAELFVPPDVQTEVTRRVVVLCCGPVWTG